ncbi:divergent polysaccharide deacetylase family protein [Desulfovibrio sp. UIB00]|uniref:divergent polysaccharide deacetylase family protein n=1 Tax=Desulfovibrio sp. UIB00 TaxID=2804314 RepID=UPI001F0DF2B4|nr:divergent polysaccharide deacetylase family protein [Desulfovibrio sp. UIB00]MCH5144369.1 divergent polysaccharide deacetylase family protein [Desulfovibrio sp. UIB00]
MGGLLWLLCSLAVSCWVYWQLEAPSKEQEAASGGVLPFAVAHKSAGARASWQGFDRALALESVDALFARALPLALPQAQWQQLALQENLPAETSQFPAGENIPPNFTASAEQAAYASAADLRQFTVSGPCAPLRLGLALLQGLRGQNPVLERAGVRAEVRWTSQGTLEVLLNHLVYYVVSFPGREGQLSDLAQPLPPEALAVVIDDMGQKLESAEALSSLLFPVTLAIWPRSPHAQETAVLAASRRLDCLLHQPMEALPRALHGRPDPGPGALLTSMSAQEVQTVLEENLRILPSVIGLNNHMGSAFTGDISLCRTLCGMLGGRGLAVLDSVTRPDPQLALAAREAGLVGLARDVFLDTRRDTAAILSALDAAAARARAQGMAVAIGHPYPETLRALRDWQDKDGVAVVPLRRILWKLAQDGAAVAARSYSANNNMEKE